MKICFPQKNNSFSTHSFSYILDAHHINLKKLRFGEQSSFFSWIYIEDKLKCTLERFLVFVSIGARARQTVIQRGTNININPHDGNAKKEKAGILGNRRSTLENTNNNRLFFIILLSSFRLCFKVF